MKIYNANLSHQVNTIKTETKSSEKISNLLVSVNNKHNDFISIKKIPYLPMKIICNYLALSDIGNLKSINAYVDLIHGEKIKKINNIKNELIEWKNEKNISPYERRDIAMNQIINCIKERKHRLVLNNLKITSLPDLKRFEFITEVQRLNCDIKNPSLKLPKLKVSVFSNSLQCKNEKYRDGEIIGYAAYRDKNGKKRLDNVYANNNIISNDGCKVKYVVLDL